MEGKAGPEGNFGKAFARVSSHFGVAFNMSLLFSVAIILYGRLPLQEWKVTEQKNGGGTLTLPRLDEDTYWFAGPTLFASIFNVMTGFYFHARLPSPLVYPDCGPPFKYKFLWVCLTAVLLLMWIAPLMLNRVLGIDNLSYYSLKGIVFMCAGYLIASLFDQKIRKLLAYRLFAAKKKRVRKVLVRHKMSRLFDTYFSKTTKSESRRTISGALNRKLGFSKVAFSFYVRRIVKVLFFCAYAMLFYPLYLSFGDGARLVYVCIIHTALTDILIGFLGGCTLVEIEKRQKDGIDEGALLPALGAHYTMNVVPVETCFSFIRRCLVASMNDPVSTTIGIILLGLEEIILRTSLKHRHGALMKRMLGRESDNDTLLFHAYVEQSLSSSVICEPTSIFTRCAAITFLAHQHYIFGFGFPNAGDASVFAMFYFDIGLEIVSEIVVDIFSFYALFIGKSDFKGNYLEGLRGSGPHLHMFFACAAGISLAFVIALNIPNSFLCDEASNPCSCDLENAFKQYASLCNVTNRTASTGIEDVITENMDNSHLFAIAIGLVSIFCVATFGIAASFWLKNTKNKRVASFMRKELQRRNSALNQLISKISADQQDKIDEKLKAEKYAPINAYSIPDSHLTMVREIAHGSAGEIWIGKYREKDVAIKKFSVRNNMYAATENFMSEALMMATLQGDVGVSHPNLVQMLYCCWNAQLLIVYEYFPLGSVDALISEVSEESCSWRHTFVWSCSDNMGDLHNPDMSTTEPGVIQNLMLDIVSGMMFCHERGIIHRDMKPGNMLVAGSREESPLKWTAQVADFGEGREIDNENTMTRKGSPLYMAPEVILCSKYDHTCDIWSFGVALLHMSTALKGGIAQCWKETPSKRFSMEAVAKGCIPHIPTYLDDECPSVARVIRSCLKIQPNQRINSFREIMGALTLQTVPSQLSIHVKESRASLGIVNEGEIDRETSISELMKKVGVLERQLMDAENKSRIRGGLKRLRSKNKKNAGRRRGSVSNVSYPTGVQEHRKRKRTIHSAPDLVEVVDPSVAVHRQAANVKRHSNPDRVAKANMI